MDLLPNKKIGCLLVASPWYLFRLQLFFPCSLTANCPVSQVTFSSGMFPPSNPCTAPWALFLFSWCYLWKRSRPEWVLKTCSNYVKLSLPQPLHRVTLELCRLCSTLKWLRFGFSPLKLRSCADTSLINRVYFWLSCKIVCLCTSLCL